MKVLLLVNGELNKPDVIRRRVQSETFDFVLGVDGGSKHAETLDVTLDAIIGDMDSVPDEEQNAANHPEMLTYPAEKDEIDLELAIRYALRKGATRIVMVGVMGGRIDMSVANILLIAHSSFEFCRLEVWEGNQTAWLIRPPGSNYIGKPGDTVSILPLGGPALDITLNGMKYPLNHALLMTGVPRGISNVIDTIPAGVTFSTGILLAVHIPQEETER